MDKVVELSVYREKREERKKEQEEGKNSDASILKEKADSEPVLSREARAFLLDVSRRNFSLISKGRIEIERGLLRMARDRVREMPKEKFVSLLEDPKKRRELLLDACLAEALFERMTGRLEQIEE